MADTATQCVTCIMRGQEVRIGKMSNDRYAVGVAGWLVGTYDDADAAIFAAREHVRVMGSCLNGLPTAGKRFVAGVKAL
jgi:hypothetical protein